MAHPNRIYLLFLAAAAGLLLVFGALSGAPAAAASFQAQPALAEPTPLPDKPPVESPDISFIDSPTASCVLPRAGTGVCYMSWNYLYATGDPNYMISMTVEIDSIKRANYSGFFQTYMYVPAELLVFKVACGASGSGGTPGLGMVHSYTLRGRDSANLKAANYGSVTCPADLPRRVYLPMQRKK